MVTVPIHQDTSLVPLMTTSVIDLTVSQPVSANVQASLPTSTTTTSAITTITTLLAPPPQPQQSTVDQTLLQHIGELEQHMANMLQYNLSLEESDLPAVDIKEILQQQMFKDKSYKAHEDHKNLVDTLEKSLEHDYSNQLLSDLEAARQKKRKRRDLPRTPSGSPLPPQPPPPPPLAGASGASGLVQQQGSKASTSSKSIATTSYSMAWTISDTRYEYNRASELVLIYEPPAENSLLAKIGDMETFMNWYCRKVNKTMEECYKLLIDQIDWANPGDLEYLRYGNKGSSPALSISKMKVARYPDFGLELLVSEQMWIDDVYMILRRVEKKSEHTCGFLVSSESKLIQDTGWDAKGYEFKYDYTIIESPRAVVFPVNNNEQNIIRFNEIYKFSDGTLTRILEALDYRVKEFKDGDDDVLDVLSFGAMGEKGAHVYVVPEVVDFLTMSLDKFGNVPVTCKKMPLNALEYESPRTIVASKRVDSIASEGFKISRAKLVGLIRDTIPLSYIPLTVAKTIIQTHLKNEILDQSVKASPSWHSTNAGNLPYDKKGPLTSYLHSTLTNDTAPSINQYKGLKTKQKRATGFMFGLKTITTRSGVRILQEGKIPSATSAANVAATYASGTQSADVALPHWLTWDLHADVVQMAEGSIPSIIPESSKSIRGMLSLVDPIPLAIKTVGGNFVEVVDTRSSEPNY
nr:RNA-binding S4 domain-containing protein [Tanacetum cinerariifolium]